MKQLKYIIASIFIVCISLFCVACKEETKSFEGEVCKLEYKEEYTTIIPITTHIYNGKTMTPIIAMYVRTYPDRWYVQVKTFNEEKQKYDYNDCYVTEATYNSLKIGDWFVYDEDYCFPEEPYTQEKERK